MFAINLDYPSFSEEVAIVKTTTIGSMPIINPLFSSKEIIFYQELIQKIPVADNVIEYAVTLVGKTRPKSKAAPELVKKYIDWGCWSKSFSKFNIRSKNIRCTSRQIFSRYRRCSKSSCRHSSSQINKKLQSRGGRSKY